MRERRKRNVNRDETRKQLVDVFKQVFGRDIALRDELTPPDVEGWDSLMHVMLIVAAEKHFGIKFKGSEIANAACVGDLVDLICSKSTA